MDVYLKPHTEREATYLHTTPNTFTKTLSAFWKSILGNNLGQGLLATARAHNALLATVGLFYRYSHGKDQIWSFIFGKSIHFGVFSTVTKSDQRRVDWCSLRFPLLHKCIPVHMSLCLYGEGSYAIISTTARPQHISSAVRHGFHPEGSCETQPQYHAKVVHIR